MKRLAIIFFIVFILAWMNQIEKMSWVGFNWFSIPNPTEIYLVEYPKNFSGKLRFEVNSNRNCPCTIYVCDKAVETTLREGSNLIELETAGCEGMIQTTVVCGESLLRFFSQKTNRTPSEEYMRAELLATQLKRAAKLDIHLTSQLNEGGYRNFEILVDGKTALRPTYLLPEGLSESNITEKLSLEPGEHSISFLYKGETLATAHLFIPFDPFPYFNGLNILLSLALAAIIHKEYSVDWLTSSLTFFGLCLSSLALQLQLTQLGFSEWLLPIIILLGVMLAWKLKKRQ